jgi:hypothetical protein
MIKAVRMNLWLCHRTALRDYPTLGIKQLDFLALGRQPSHNLGVSIQII